MYRLFAFLRKQILKKNINLCYNKYWRGHHSATSKWTYGSHFSDIITSEFPPARKVLDAGSGSGDLVRILLQNNYDAYGIELSSYIVNKAQRDLKDVGRISIGSLADLPYADNMFDLVTCFDVLEHIPESVVVESVREIVRVSKKDIFCTISLRPSSNNNEYHCTLRSRAWWEKLFVSAGAVVNEDLVRRLQHIEEGADMRVILQRGPTKVIMNELEWFITSPPYSLNGEFEPWFFAFSKKI